MKNQLKSDKMKSQVKDILIIVIIVGVIYFGFRGSMMLALGTTSPLTGVTGDSMTHTDNSWKNYYIEKGYDVSKFPLKGGLEPGDLVIVKDVDSIKDIQTGDVVIWHKRGGKRIIHRVAVIENQSGEPYIRTRSDKYQVLDQEKIEIDEIVGKAIFAIPYLGYPSTWF